MKIQEIGKVITGKTPPTREKKFFNGEYPFITPTDIQDYNVRFLEQTERNLSQEWANIQPKYLLPPNTICYVCIGSTVGKICMNRISSFTNQQINSIICDSKVANPFYVFYKLKLETPKIKSIASARGAGKSIMNKTDFENLELDVADLTNQNKIVSVLSAYDDLIENNNRRIKVLEEMTQTIYNEWFVKFRFPGQNKVKMVDSELGKIPEGWEVVKVGDVIERFPSGKKYDNKTVLPKGKVPVLDQGRSGIIGYHNNEPDVIASEEKPIIIFANHTCYQRIITFPFSAIQNVIPLLPLEEKKRDIYWLHWATKDVVKFNDYKGHFPEFASKKIIFPPEKICDDFGSTIKPMIQQKYKLEQKNKILQESRDLLLPKLISGEIDVGHLDIKTEDKE